ncbi:MAG: N-formylglutamate amidohydrolase, partial [Kiloniellales bacterium]|nr:N-formylglutamate amidohydrolase [Kiloniellales bacterium]
SEAQRRARIENFFMPYHRATHDLIESRIAAGRRPALISMHSFTPVMNGFERPWKIGVLWNKDGRLPLPLIHRLRAIDIQVGDNEPYSGRDNHGYSQHVHADDRGLANALIEVRQDLIDTHHGAEEWGGILSRVLQEILSDPELYRAYP